MNNLKRPPEPRMPSLFPWQGVVLAALIMLMPAGCTLITKTVYIESRRPVLRVRRDPIPNDPPEYTAREVVMFAYVRKLEGIIRRYNEAARKHNEKNGYGREQEGPEAP